MGILYTFFIRLYYLAAIALSLSGNKKAKLWVQGRRESLSAVRNFKRDNKKKVIWFHTASLGEFEQARPLIEELHKTGNFSIAVTFFSPSGYEQMKNYPLADLVCYIPLDINSKAAQFLNLLKPDCFILVKYEFWHHFIRQAKERNIPIFSISSAFRKDHYFFKPGMGWFLNSLKLITHFFVQNEASKAILEQNQISQVSLSGDTRFDRVYATANNDISFPLIESFKQNAHLLILGSSYLKEEELLSSYLKNQGNQNWKFIVAPHNIDQKHLEKIIALFSFSETVLYSKASVESLSNAKVLIIDNIGMLSRLYRYADLAVIGGGFNHGIHNVLEPTAFGLPILFGPKHQKFPEAKQLIELGAAKNIENQHQFNTALDFWMNNDTGRSLAKENGLQFINQNRGATEFILNKMIESIGVG
jgi:3-deoxy-D-manno-octulosonic-acid transferase